PASGHPRSCPFGLAFRRPRRLPAPRPAVVPPSGSRSAGLVAFPPRDRPALPPGPVALSSVDGSPCVSGWGCQVDGRRARAWWTERTALAPSPTAAATRFIDDRRTSPA